MNVVTLTKRNRDLPWWIVLGVAVGLMVGIVFDLSARQMVFPVVLLPGLYLLVQIGLQGRQVSFGAIGGWGQLKLPPESGMAQEAGNHPLERGDDNQDMLLPSAEAVVTSLLEIDGDLSDDQIRGWLDEFLLRQQK